MPPKATSLCGRSKILVLEVTSTGEACRGDARSIPSKKSAFNDLKKVDSMGKVYLNLVKKAILAHRWHIEGVYLELGRMEILSIF